MDHKTKLEMERSRKREADAKQRRDMWARAMKREREFRAQFEDVLEHDKGASL